MKRRGFTIVELLIVITIMGALLILSVANLRGSQISARDSERKTDVETIALHLDNFYVFGSDTSTTLGRYPSTTLTNILQILVVAGGGGGNGGTSGINFGDGGGGGTVIFSNTYVATAGNKTVNVGLGGLGVNTGTAGSGGDSWFDTIRATGGTGVINTSRTGGANANYSGGTASSGTNSGAGAGGGANGLVSVAGSGYLSSINEYATYYAGGGGAVVSAIGQSGGSGGGGAGSTSSAGISGLLNTGGGGGGANSGNAGGSGGSGIVIISYPTGSMTATGGNTTATLNGNTIHTFNGNGLFVITTTITNSSIVSNIKRTLRDIDKESLTAPDADPDTTFISATNNIQLTTGQSTVQPLPTTSRYVYQPLQSDGTLCVSEAQECRKFNLYYRLESLDVATADCPDIINKVCKITSKNQ